VVKLGLGRGRGQRRENGFVELKSLRNRNPCFRCLLSCIESVVVLCGGSGSIASVVRLGELSIGEYIPKIPFAVVVGNTAERNVPRVG
jgi:hypothetical protein